MSRRGVQEVRRSHDPPIASSRFADRLSPPYGEPANHTVPDRVSWIGSLGGPRCGAIADRGTTRRAHRIPTGNAVEQRKRGSRTPGSKRSRRAFGGVAVL